MNLYALSPLGVTIRGDELIPFLRTIVAEHPTGAYTVHGIMYNLMSGVWTCWTVGEDENNISAVGATMTYDDMLGRKVCRVIFLAGDMRGQIKKIMQDLKNICTEAGMSRVETLGRKGLIRALDGLGFEHEFVVLRCELDAPRSPTLVVRPNVDQVGRA